MDMVEVLESIQKITSAGNPTREKQKTLSVSDVWHLWDMLVAKYDTIEVINILLNFTKDEDLEIVARNILSKIERGASAVEQLMLEYAIPLPPRPPQAASTTINLELITDKYAFSRIFDLTKQLLPLLATAFNSSTAPKTIKFFKTHLIETLEIVDNLSVYGETKGYLPPIPNYMP